MSSTNALTYALTGGGRELLRIDGARARYLVLAAAHPAWRSRAGLYEAELPGSLAEQAASVASSLVDGDVRPRGRTGPVLTAEVDGRTETTALDDPETPAGTLLSAVIDLVRPRPVSVVALTAELINGTDLRLSFAAEGSEALDLQLRRESCRVSVVVDGVWRDCWSTASAGSEARLTLIAPPVGFVDGVRTPALLEPGTVGRTMLPGALAGADDHATQAVVEIDATLEIPEIDDLAEADVDGAGLTVDLRGRWPIHLTSAPVPLR